MDCSCIRCIYETPASLVHYLKDKFLKCFAYLDIQLRLSELYFSYRPLSCILWQWHSVSAAELILQRHRP